MTKTAHDTRPSGDRPMIDREESWLRFNERVLEEARDPEVPLLERLRFLTIFHTNLDEFFMIRVSGIKQQVEAGVEVLSHDGRSPRQRHAEISLGARELLAAADLTLRSLMDELVAHKIEVVSYDDLDDTTRARWDEIYQRKVHPTLTPLAVSPAFPFPFISNLSLNLAVLVRDAEGERRLVRIKVPDHLPRFVPIDDVADATRPPVRLLPIEELIAANLHSMFPGMSVGRPLTFRVTRDADVEIREDEADDLLQYIEDELRKRRFGEAVRLEVTRDAPPHVLEILQRGLNIDDVDIYRTDTWVDPTGLSRLIDLDMPELKFMPFAPLLHPALESDGFFDRVASEDVLLHHPFDSFTPVAEFVRQAARDPEVLAIKQTLYRTSGDSPVIAALLEAVENGKQVAAVVELKARFDEENNIGWARRLEEAGVHVIYGVPGLKTHAKLSLVVRREGRELRRYAHIGTGNYNPITARIYTDLGLFTCDPDITADIADLFNRITGFARPPGYRKALVAPHFMKDALLDLIRFETAEAAAGRPARLLLKCNAIIERDVVQALYDASDAGVRIDLMVRGICGVIPGREGMSENIRVRSVVGRFLEHSRVYWFHHGGDTKVYLGSADLMGRNLLRRIEVLVPVESAPLRTWLREVYLERYLTETERSRRMLPDGTYVRERELLEVGAPGRFDVHDSFLDEI